MPLLLAGAKFQPLITREGNDGFRRSHSFRKPRDDLLRGAASADKTVRLTRLCYFRVRLLEAYVAGTQGDGNPGLLGIALAKLSGSN
jgi:hypothetical protein